MINVDERGHTPQALDGRLLGRIEIVTTAGEGGGRSLDDGGQRESLCGKGGAGCRLVSTQVAEMLPRQMRYSLGDRAIDSGDGRQPLLTTTSTHPALSGRVGLSFLTDSHDPLHVVSTQGAVGRSKEQWCCGGIETPFLKRPG
jgi:hypothetical protein